MPSDELVVTIAREMQSVIKPLITDADQMSVLGTVTADKGEGHTAHELDRRAESVLFKILERSGYEGRVYSEESKLVELGSEPRLIVCDPYCNTTLSFRGFRESAIAVYEYTLAGNFTAGAIADLQIPRIIWADSSPGVFITTFNPACEGHSRAAENIKRAGCSKVSRVNDAFLTISMLKRNRRQELLSKLLSEAEMVTTIDGAIVAARLAIGEIDGFVDVIIGQPSYEALAYSLVAKAGGIVTDPDGVLIDFGRIVIALAENEVTRHTMVATCNRALHASILTMISNGS
jgi:fructose-1,6-bisphosphatase/inositol monophosphatase family enzyme